MQDTVGDGRRVGHKRDELNRTFCSILHELANLGFRWTHSNLLVDDITPPHINGGETGNHFEHLAFGGMAGFVFEGTGEWDGSQEYICILIEGESAQNTW